MEAYGDENASRLDDEINSCKSKMRVRDAILWVCKVLE